MHEMNLQVYLSQTGVKMAAMVCFESTHRTKVDCHMASIEVSDALVTIPKYKA